MWSLPTIILLACIFAIMRTGNAKPKAHMADSQLNGSMIVAHEDDFQWELLTVAKRQTSNPCANVVVGWLSWSSWSTCTQTCGACGTQVRTRTCLTPIPECKCPGDNADTTSCGETVCVYPMPMCCGGRTLGSENGRFVCV